MVILFMIFLIQFFVAVACLAVSEAQVHHLVEDRWHLATPSVRTPYSSLSNSSQNASCALKVQHMAMTRYECCAPGQQINATGRAECLGVVGHSWTDEAKANFQYPPCEALIPKNAIREIHVVGGVSLFFSFSEVGLALSTCLVGYVREAQGSIIGDED